MARNPARESEDLKSRCQRARNAIADMFIHHIVHPPENPSLVAWGQYLDLLRKNVSKQYGIYATSAGLQVLAMHDPAIFEEAILAAARTLPFVSSEERGEDRRVHEYFINKGDLAVVYKVAALADAVYPQATIIDEDHRLVEALYKLRRPGGGWSYYLDFNLKQFEGPNVQATATALLSLGRFSGFHQSHECREALDWLAKNLDTSSLSISTLSIIIMALQILHDRHERTPTMVQLRQRCLSVLTDWARTARPNDVERTLEATDYFLPKPHAETPLGNKQHEFTFMLYLPHCLAALALMRAGASDRRCQRFLTSVVDIVATTVCSKGSFVTAGRSLVSSVEHLWVYRLLREFELYNPDNPSIALIKNWFSAQSTK